MDVTSHLDGFVKAIGRNEILPFLGAYQRLVYSYFFFKKLTKKHKLDLVLITGGSTLIPKSMASKTIVYVHYLDDVEVASEGYLRGSILKKMYIQPWIFISNYLNTIKSCTILTNSNYTKDLIRSTWDTEAHVIYPPCPQYDFSQEYHLKEDAVCCLSRFTPGKEYEQILQIAAKLPKVRFELLGSVTLDKIPYLMHLKKVAPQNVAFHINATVAEKKNVLKHSKVLLHAFKGEHFGIALVEAMSAGAIPVTHNSGAAKEDKLVPIRFRYNDHEEATRCVTDALSYWNVGEANRLSQTANKYSPESFREKIKSFISDWIRRNSLS